MTCERCKTTIRVEPFRFFMAALIESPPDEPVILGYMSMSLCPTCAAICRKEVRPPRDTVVQEALFKPFDPGASVAPPEPPANPMDDLIVLLAKATPAQRETMRTLLGIVTHSSPPYPKRYARDYETMKEEVAKAHVAAAFREASEKLGSDADLADGKRLLEVVETGPLANRNNRPERNFDEPAY